MLSTLSQSKKKGFTIIEVLIVLAIAGLILLVVFLAVPALQRNSRNTQLKSAASSILGVVNEFTNNNNGQVPDTVAVASDGTVTASIAGGVGTTPATGKVQAGYSASVGTTMPTTTGAFVVNTNHKCNNNAFSTTSTPRAVAIGFKIETGGGTADQCVES
jgi:prepilin-type N-terminal cleavage/methylation domain-containing protein